MGWMMDGWMLSENTWLQVDTGHSLLPQAEGQKVEDPVDHQHPIHHQEAPKTSHSSWLG